MARLFAIDCDARELCFVLANTAGERVTLEAAKTITLKSSADDSPLADDELGKQLQSLLSGHKRSGAKVLAAVDRNSIELFEITAPPATDAELPELVLNQLMMEAPNIVDESVIDFIPDHADATGPRKVKAAALSQAEFKRVSAICSSAGFAPDCMLMRSYETASLFLRQRTTTGGAALLVNVVADEVDLIVVDQVHPLFFRTVRLPGRLGDETTEQRLLDEIRRTLLVAPPSSEGTHVIESVYLFGTTPDHERLVQQIGKDSPAKVELFDPFAGFVLGNEWEHQTSGRLAPLLGMLLEEAHGGKHTIDFLHPRQAPKPPNRIRQLVTGVAIAVSVIGAGGYYVWDLFESANATNKQLSEQLKDVDSLVKKMTEKKKVTEAIDDWSANSIVWLDELRDLSAKFPPGQDLVIQRLAMTPSRGGKASIAFQGLAREPKVVSKMEAALRDGRHEVQTPRVEERTQDKLYPWSFETAVSLSPAKLDLDAITAMADEESEAKEKSETDDAKPAKTRKPVNRRSNAKKKTKDDSASAKEQPPAQSEPADETAKEPEKTKTAASEESP